MIPLTVDVTLVLLGPVILVISLLLRVLLVLMVPCDLEFPLVLVVSHGFVVPVGPTCRFSCFSSSSMVCLFP